MLTHSPAPLTNERTVPHNELARVAAMIVSPSEEEYPGQGHTCDKAQKNKRCPDHLCRTYRDSIGVIAFADSLLYAKHKGIDEHTILKWINILIATAIVFGPAAKRFWRLRTK
jgi:hypothetical protein